MRWRNGGLRAARSACKFAQVVDVAHTDGELGEMQHGPANSVLVLAPTRTMPMRPNDWNRHHRRARGYAPPFTSIVAQVMNDAASADQEVHHRGNFVRFTGTTERAGLRALLPHLWRSCAHRRIDQAWGDRIDPDAVPTEPRAKAFGEIDDRCLGGAVLHRRTAALSGRMMRG